MQGIGTENDFQTWRIATENRTSWMRGKEMNDLGCLEVCCDIKSVSKADSRTFSLVVFRSAFHGLTLIEDSRYVPDDPMMKR